MRVTMPSTPPTETMSPTRTGRSNRIIRPDTKLAKISCKPKPRPTEMAAARNCTWFQLMPIRPKLNTMPTMVIT